MSVLHDCQHGFNQTLNRELNIPWIDEISHPDFSSWMIFSSFRRLAHERRHAYLTNQCTARIKIMLIVDARSHLTQMQPEYFQLQGSCNAHINFSDTYMAIELK
jgi:hypothetical protein